MEFSSFGGFATHLQGLATTHTVREHRALERAAKLVLRAAQAKFGEYQPSAGPFPAWAQLSASTMSDRTSRGFSSNQPLLRMGELRDSYTYEVAHGEANIGSPLQRALWLEAGTVHMPPRSVVGAALVENAEKVVDLIGGGIVSGLLGGTSAELARG